MKSERLKKIEKEFRDLKQWLELDLVPKKDIEKHKLEMSILTSKIEEEKQRLIFLKENGDMEEYNAQKKPTQQKQLYEHQSIPDIQSDDDNTDALDESTFEADHTTLFDIEMGGDEEKTTTDYENEDDPFSEKNRWSRSLEIQDPESNNW